MARPRRVTHRQYREAMDGYVEGMHLQRLATALHLDADKALMVLDGKLFEVYYETLPASTKHLIVLSRRHRAPGSLIRFLLAIAQLRRAGHDAAEIARRLKAPPSMVEDVVRHRAYQVLYGELSGKTISNVFARWVVTNMEDEL